MTRLDHLGHRIARFRRWAARTFLQPKLVLISHRPADPPAPPQRSR